MTPEEAFEMAWLSIGNQQWDKATAYATTGLLSLGIGAAKGLLKAADTEAEIYKLLGGEEENGH